jgi:hypothetical protein
MYQYLGPKLADKHEVEFSPEVMKKGETTWNTVQYGYNKGANQVYLNGKRYDEEIELWPLTFFFNLSVGHVLWFTKRNQWSV